MTLWVDGSGWDGKVSRYAIVWRSGSHHTYTTPEKHTNNEMEYMAIIGALELDITKDGDEILTDSRLIIGHLTLGWKRNFVHLQALYDKLTKLLQTKNVTIRWVPRNENRAGKLIERELAISKTPATGSEIV
jgi:ribonuclease HI